MRALVKIIILFNFLLLGKAFASPNNNLRGKRQLFISIGYSPSLNFYSATNVIIHPQFLQYNQDLDSDYNLMPSNDLKCRLLLSVNKSELGLSIYKYQLKQRLSTQRNSAMQYLITKDNFLAFELFYNRKLISRKNYSLVSTHGLLFLTDYSNESKSYHTSKNTPALSDYKYMRNYKGMAGIYPLLKTGMEVKRNITKKLEIASELSYILGLRNLTTDAAIFSITVDNNKAYTGNIVALNKGDKLSSSIGLIYKLK